MSKRRPTSELNHENWNAEDVVEEAGSFQLASSEQLRGRKILKPRRKVPEASAGGQSNPFLCVPNFAPASTPITPAIIPGPAALNPTTTEQPHETGEQSNPNPFSSFGGFVATPAETAPNTQSREPEPNLNLSDVGVETPKQNGNQLNPKVCEDQIAEAPKISSGTASNIDTSIDLPPYNSQGSGSGPDSVSDSDGVIRKMHLNDQKEEGESTIDSLPDFVDQSDEEPEPIRSAGYHDNE